MLFPAFGPEYYNADQTGILSYMNAAYAESITMNQQWWSRADVDTRATMGDIALWNDLYGNLPSNRRQFFNFNRILRIVNLIDGYQRRNRKSTIVVPFQNADQVTADQYTKILMWCNKQEGILNTISDAFRGSLITGMNLLHVYMDYRNDPISGDIKVDKCAYNSFLIDPFFRKSDLSDANYIWKRSFLTKREVLSLLPSMEEEVMALQPNSSGSGRDGKFQFMPETYSYSMKNLLAYDEFYYRTYRTQQLLVDTQTGETLEWRNDDQDKLKQYLQLYPQVKVIETQIPTCNLAIVVQNAVMYDGPNPMGIDRYPIVPVMAYYEASMPYLDLRLQGVVRSLVDSNYLYTRRKMIELDILESQIASGWVARENAFINPKDAYTQTGQGKVLYVKDMDKPLSEIAQRVEPPQVPPSMIELSRILAQEIQEISGVNEELLGSASDDKAGILSMLRQGAGLTTLQILFDNLDYAQKQLGEIMIDLIQANFTPGKVQNILEGEQPAPLFYKEAFGKYHAAVEEGLNTTTQKQMQFAQMVALREAGVPIPDDQLLEAATIQNKTKIIESIQANQQAAAQAQQAAQQAALEETQARIELTRATAYSQQGQGDERYSRIPENKALAIERVEEARKDAQLAELNKIKALKELQTLDLADIERLMNLLEKAKQIEQAQIQKELESPSTVENGSQS